MGNRTDYCEFIDVYVFNQISSIEDMQSADLVVFALNVLYITLLPESACKRVMAVKECSFLLGDW